MTAAAWCQSPSTTRRGARATHLVLHHKLREAAVEAGQVVCRQLKFLLRAVAVSVGVGAAARLPSGRARGGEVRLDSRDPCALPAYKTSKSVSPNVRWRLVTGAPAWSSRRSLASVQSPQPPQRGGALSPSSTPSLSLSTLSRLTAAREDQASCTARNSR